MHSHTHTHTGDEQKDAGSVLLEKKKDAVEPRLRANAQDADRPCYGIAAFGEREESKIDAEVLRA